MDEYFHLLWVLEELETVIENAVEKCHKEVSLKKLFHAEQKSQAATEPASILDAPVEQGQVQRVEYYKKPCLNRSSGCLDNAIRVQKGQIYRAYGIDRCLRREL